MKKLSNIFLIGPMGSGKTTIGTYLAEQLNRPFIDSDTVITETANADIEAIFDLEGEEGFRNREEQAIEKLTDKQNIVLATGGGVILRKENRQRLEKNGVVFFLDPTLDIQIKHIAQDKQARPLLAGEQDLRQKLEMLNKERRPLYEEAADFIIPINDDSAEQIANHIIGINKVL